jgi:phosphatidylglycerol:prolipoprotein diacylglycerol transferase
MQCFLFLGIYFGKNHELAPFLRSIARIIHLEKFTNLSNIYLIIATIFRLTGWRNAGNHAILIRFQFALRLSVMWPILGRYGPFFLFTYNVVLGLGILLALGMSALMARRYQLTGWIDGWLLAGTAAVITGRLVFVQLNEVYFAENPAEVWQVWRGGVNVHGALLGALLVYWLWSRIRGRRFGVDAGILAPGLAIIVAAGWAACWFEGCAYGKEALPGLLSADLPDHYGVFASRYQTQLAGGLSSLVIFMIAWWAAGRVRLPVVFWATLGLLAISHGGIAFFRGDPAPTFGSLRVDIVVDLILVATCALALVRLAIDLKKPTR